MTPSDAERLATIEQVLRDVRDDVHGLGELRKEDHHRLRAVETAAGLLLEDQKQATLRRDYELRRLGVKVQWLTLIVAAGSFALGVAVALLAH